MKKIILLTTAMILSTAVNAEMSDVNTSQKTLFGAGTSNSVKVMSDASGDGEFSFSMAFKGRATSKLSNDTTIVSKGNSDLNNTLLTVSK